MPIVVFYFLHQLTVRRTKTNSCKRTSCKICYWITLVCGIFFEKLLLSGFKRAARKERNISVAGLHVDKGEGVLPARVVNGHYKTRQTIEFPWA